MKQYIRSGYPFESEYGYSRALRVGKTIYVSGTTAREDDLEKDAYGQAESLLSIIAAALNEAGASLSDVVRTVVYVTSMKDISLIAKAHVEAFGAAKPVSTLVEVSKLTPTKAVVEFEVTACLDD